MRTYGVLLVKLKSGEVYRIDFEDQLYFTNLPDNTGVVGLVYYEYIALDGICRPSMTPYQEVASGYENEKFNGDYGRGMPPMETMEPEITLDNSVDETGPIDVSASSVTLTYSMTFQRLSWQKSR